KMPAVLVPGPAPILHEELRGMVHGTGGCSVHFGARDLALEATAPAQAGRRPATHFDRLDPLQRLLRRTQGQGGQEPGDAGSGGELVSSLATATLRRSRVPLVQVVGIDPEIGLGGVTRHTRPSARQSWDLARGHHNGRLAARTFRSGQATDEPAAHPRRLGEGLPRTREREALRAYLR